MTSSFSPTAVAQVADRARRAAALLPEARDRIAKGYPLAAPHMQEELARALAAIEA